MSLPSTGADDWANTIAPAIPNAASAQKKPRHRHAPEQLAALNDLFDKDEHPPLEIRSALAERLGMDTKMVNSWFQNKRQTKKRNRNGANAERAAGPHLNPAASLNSTTSIPRPELPSSTSPPSPHRNQIEEDYHPSTTHIQQPAPSKLAISDIVQSANISTFLAQPDYLSSGRNSPDMPKKMRMRPSNDQTEELKKLFDDNPHPTAEDRQALAERIGMRYQSVTNWFQNQRSVAKRRKDDDGSQDGSQSSSSKADYLHHGDSRQYSAFPPPPPVPPHQLHPSLIALSNAALSSSAEPYVSSKPEGSTARRSASPPPPSIEVSPRRNVARARSVTPYSNAIRPRRSRPEPYQLDALKVLFNKTRTPTIEERSALALEIGMDVGKVTNWFRNLRQTARKRSSRFNDDPEGANSGLEDDDADLNDDLGGPYSSVHSRSVSRVGTPSLSARSSSSSSMEADVRMRDATRSNGVSDDEDYSGPITPEPGKSPSPTPGARKFEGRELPPPPPPPNPLPTHPPQVQHRRDEPFLPPPAPYPPYPYTHSRQPYPPPPPPHPYYAARHPHSQPHPHPYDLPPKALMEMNGPPELANAAFRQYGAGVAIFDSTPPVTYPYNPVSASTKAYYANEDPVACAAAAKKYGINIEDAYLLLDFHRQ